MYRIDRTESDKYLQFKLATVVRDQNQNEIPSSSTINRKNSDNGYFIGPTLIDKVNPSMKSYENEIFGPVLQIIEVNSMDEALEIMNKNKCGNGCCIFTSSGEKARKFSQNVNICSVWACPQLFHSKKLSQI